MRKKVTQSIVSTGPQPDGDYFNRETERMPGKWTERYRPGVGGTMYEREWTDIILDVING